MYSLLKRFHRDESGAVTVDWVVLTAAVVTLSIVAVATVKSGVDTSAGKINHALVDQQHALTTP